MLPLTSYASIFSFLWGTAPHNAVQEGNFVFHIYDIWEGNKKNRPYFYPYMGGTYDGVNFTYFRNTFDRNAFGLGIQRSVYNKEYSNHSKISIDYRVGVVYGYCWGSFRCSNHAPPIIPAAQLVVDYMYKNAGIEFSYAGVVLTSGLVVYF